MNTIVELQDLVLQQVNERDDIEDIQESLFGLYNLNPSPTFCQSLFIPLIQHANNNLDLNQDVDIYSRILSELYRYTYKKNINKGNKLFKQCSFLSKEVVDILLEEEDSFSSSKYGFQLESFSIESLLNFLAISTQACCSIIQYNSKCNSNISNVWCDLPRILNCCRIDPPYTIPIKIIKACLNICQIVVKNPNYLNFENVLTNLLLLLNHDTLPELVLDDISNSITLILQANPSWKLIDPYSISSIVNSISSTIERKEFNPTRIKCILTASCLLLRNYLKAPWLSDILVISTTDELEIVKKKTELLIDYTENIDFVNSQIEDMDIDHHHENNDTKFVKNQTMDAVINCDSIHTTLLSRLESIIEELICLNPGDNKYSVLIIKIKEISIYTDNADILTMCKPYIKDIAEFVTKILILDPGMAENIVQLFDYNIPRFINTYLGYILPYSIIHMTDNDTLMGISTSLNSSMKKLCQDNAQHILLALFMETSTKIRTFGYNRLQKIFNTKSNIHIELARKNATKITTSLSMNLGLPDLKDRAIKAIEEMKSLFGMSTTSLSDYLSTYIVGILAKIATFISEKREQNAYIHVPHALAALKEVIIILQPNINDHALHLIKTLQAINELNGMQIEALSLWKQLISTMDDDCIISNLNGIIKGLLQILPFANHNIRIAVSMTIENVLYKKIASSRSPSDLPVLPDFEELKNLKLSLKTTVATNTKNIKPSIQLSNLINNLSSPDDVRISFELQRLDEFLSKNIFTPKELAPLYSQLLYLIRKYSSNKEITELSSVCLGKMGAVNPSLMDVKMIEDDILLMETFSSETENRDFICGLISNSIFPAYNATSNETKHQYMQVSIQSLLKCAGFTDIQTMKQTRPLTYRRWSALPPAIREFSMPFLQSSFECDWRRDTIHYPIFPQAESFSDWIQKWFCQMVSVTRGNAKNILEACIPLVNCDNNDITTLLIPYAAFYIVVNCSADFTVNIKDEMLLILDLNAEYNDHSAKGKMNYQALQVVVSITEYFRKWLNNINPDNRRIDSVVRRVGSFLEYIPEKKMAIAAFNSGAYPQALMHFETYLKSLPVDQSIDPAILNYLQHIYTQLENRTDLAVLLETYSTILSHDKEIIRFETSGKWQEAEVMYKAKMNVNSSDLSSYTGYLNCFKKRGNHETVLYLAEKFSIDKPEWTAAINSFRVDSAWRVEDWNTLDRAVHLPMQNTPEALIGCVLAKMKSSQNLQVAHSIEQVRNNLIENLTSNNAESYRKSYDTIYNLQLIRELEEAQQTWESSNPIDRIEKIIARWEKSDRNLVSRYQYKHNLLELRKAAYFAIRSNIDAGPQTSQLFLKLAKSRRKAGNLSAALDALIAAEKAGGKVFVCEKAKWYWASGYRKDAFELLRSVKNRSQKEAILMAKFWRFEPSFARTAEIRQCYLEAMRSKDATQKAFNLCAQFYYNSYAAYGRIEEARIKSLYYIVKTAIKGLKIGSKYYYNSMSLIINSWFDAASLEQMDLTDNIDVANTIQTALSDIHRIINSSLSEVPAFQFIPFLPRLISHLNIQSVKVAGCLTNIICYVFLHYPRSSIWLMMGGYSADNKYIEARMNHVFEKVKAVTNVPGIASYITQAYRLIQALKCLSRHEAREFELSIKDKEDLASIVRLKDLDIYIPTETNLYPVLPEVINRGVSKYNPFPENMPTIRRIGNKVVVMKSLQKPKKIVFEGSDGKQYNFLVKSQDDLLKDARTMELNYAINSFLKKSPDARDSELYIRTYAVVPLGYKWGLIQWIDNLAPLKGIVVELIPGIKIAQINSLMSMHCGEQSTKLKHEKESYFKNTILPMCPPVFYKWFLKRFPEPNVWLTSRTRFVKTLAVMSIVGYMIGLGDRHAENILFDEIRGDCVHVDLNMLFDKGEILQVPEVVPFRLTHNLVKAMGVLGYNGLFTNTCEITMNVMLQNKEALISVFQTLANSYYNPGSDKPPNKSFIDSTSTRFKIEPGESANKKVKELIITASSNANLAKMFPGWAPYI